MTAIIDVILPVFAIMLAGVAAARFRLFPDGASEVLSLFVYYAAGPALIVVSLSRTPVGDFFNWAFLGALGGGMAVILGLSLLIAGRFFPGSLADLGLHGMSSMYSSTGYIGIPLLLIAFGDAAIVPAIIGAVITGAIFLPIAIVLAEVDQGGHRANRLLRSLFGAAISPFVVSTAAGLGISALGLVLPVAAATFFDILGGAFGPSALFAAGLFIGSRRIRAAAPEVSWLVFVKLVLQPLITWWLAYQVFGLSGIWAAAAVIHSALPTGVPVFVVAQRYKTHVERSSAVVVVSTGLSVATLSVLLVLLDVK